MVVKFTSEMIANPSGGSSGLGFLVVMNNLNKKDITVTLHTYKIQVLIFCLLTIMCNLWKLEWSTIHNGNKIRVSGVKFGL